MNQAIQMKKTIGTYIHLENLILYFEFFIIVLL